MHIIFVPPLADVVVNTAFHPYDINIFIITPAMILKRHLRYDRLVGLLVVTHYIY